MSFLYPRTVTIKRPCKQSGAGEQGYGGVSPSDEKTLFMDVECSIQEPRNVRNKTGLPTDTPLNVFPMFIPLSSGIGNGDIEGGDIAIDDLGNRYQLQDPYWDSMGHKIDIMQLET
jgi:hypothetical protein